MTRRSARPRRRRDAARARALPGRLRRRPLDGAQGDRRRAGRHAGDPARAVDLHPRAGAARPDARRARPGAATRSNPRRSGTVLRHRRPGDLAGAQLPARRRARLRCGRPRLRAIRAILGVGADFEYEVLSKEDWIGRRLVADRFRDRRVFICGDAAHLWVPYAGYGMNAGIADAMNLSWQLAARLAGWAERARPRRLRGRAPADHRAGLALRHGPRAADDQGARRGARRASRSPAPEGDAIRAEAGREGLRAQRPAVLLRRPELRLLLRRARRSSPTTARPRRPTPWAASRRRPCPAAARRTSGWPTAARSTTRFGRDYTLLRFDPRRRRRAARRRPRARAACRWRVLDVAARERAGRVPPRAGAVPRRPARRLARRLAVPADARALVDRSARRRPTEARAMNTADLIAIDTHTHAEVSCWNPFDNYGEEYDRAADKYFRSSRRPTIEETIAYYRERKIGLVMFTVDAETQMGRRRIPNEEIAEAAQKNSDIMIAFGSIDPHKGKMGAREARRLIEEHGVKGFKFHPTVQGFDPDDRMAWPIYEVIAEHKLPAIFHSGHSGIGSGMRCGGGLRLQNSNPMQLDDVAIDFPDMQIVIAHPSWPWQDEAISLAMHKPNVWIDLSGWSPKYFPPQLVQYANTLLKDRILFGSDYPLITPDRWMKDFEEAGFKHEVQAADPEGEREAP